MRDAICVQMLDAICVQTRGKSKLEQLPCEQFFLQIEISRAFLSPDSHVQKCGKFQFVVEIAHKAIILIVIYL